MKAWQFFILMSVIISNGSSTEYRVELSGFAMVCAIVAMIFPPKSERDKP